LVFLIHDTLFFSSQLDPQDTEIGATQVYCIEQSFLIPGSQDMLQVSLHLNTLDRLQNEPDLLCKLFQSSDTQSSYTDNKSASKITFFHEDFMQSAATMNLHI
jgi:hypothetical protein